MQSTSWKEKLLGQKYSQKSPIHPNSPQDVYLTNIHPQEVSRDFQFDYNTSPPHPPSWSDLLMENLDLATSEPPLHNLILMEKHLWRLFCVSQDYHLISCIPRAIIELKRIVGIYQDFVQIRQLQHCNLFGCGREQKYICNENWLIGGQSEWGHRGTCRHMTLGTWQGIWWDIWRGIKGDMGT